MCRIVPDIYLAGNGVHYVRLDDGTVIMRANASFAGALAYHHVPEWLTEITVPGNSNYLAFEVKQ